MENWITIHLGDNKSYTYNIYGSGSYYFIRRMKETETPTDDADDLGYARSFDEALKVARADAETRGEVAAVEINDLRQ